MSKGRPLPILPRTYSRLPSSVKKVTMSFSVPERTGIAIRKIAIKMNRTASDLVGESMQYWLDSNYPAWDLDTPAEAASDENVSDEGDTSDESVVDEAVADDDSVETENR